MKRCTKCGEVKDEAEFYKNRTTKDGLQLWCKKCIRSGIAAYYATNKKKVAARKAVFYAANREKAVASQTKWRAANREKVAALNASWRAANKDKESAMKAAYYVANRDKILDYKTAYYATNRKKVIDRTAAYTKNHPEQTAVSNYLRRLRTITGIELTRRDIPDEVFKLGVLAATLSRELKSKEA